MGAVAGYVLATYDTVQINGSAPPSPVTAATLVVIGPDGARATYAASIQDASQGIVSAQFTPSLPGVYLRAYIVTLQDGTVAETDPMASFSVSPSH